ncbi:excisionase family DNA-binding protein [Streptomyces sp. AA1529]|uniref:excisionase family DNA-binding protein n=1 Tax=Streptomyces sp. AA1529 TaxID=1203257 RepID=UPI0002F19346|nr:excisionase family DNA-binding protein [Streptomyces sp. AA1529]
MTTQTVAPRGDYLSTGAAAKRIGITPQHVRRLIASGHLPAINVAVGTKRPRFRIAEAAITTYLHGAQVGAKPDAA